MLKTDERVQCEIATWQIYQFNSIGHCKTNSLTDTFFRNVSLFCPRNKQIQVVR